MTAYGFTQLGTASNYSAIADFHALQFTATHTHVGISDGRVVRITPLR
jgi:hypothetical protein